MNKEELKQVLIDIIKMINESYDATEIRNQNIEVRKKLGIEKITDSFDSDVVSFPVWANEIAQYPFVALLNALEKKEKELKI